MFAQRRGGLQSDGLRDAIDRPVTLLEQLLSAQNPLVRQPPMGSGSGLLPESTGERSRRHVCLLREIVDGQVPIEMRLGPLEDACQPSRFVGRNRPDRELRLSTLAKRWHDEPACNVIRDLCSKVAPDDVQA